MNDKTKCECGCPRSRHAHVGIGRGHCIDCGSIQCPEFRPAEESKPDREGTTMSDAKCVCGHWQNGHLGSCLNMQCSCTEFTPVLEANPAPAPEKCDCGGSVHMMSHTKGCSLFDRAAP
jgi:hypothetical protein